MKAECSSCYKLFPSNKIILKSKHDCMKGQYHLQILCEDCYNKQKQKAEIEKMRILKFGEE